MGGGVQEEAGNRGPSYTVTCEDYVHVVEFSPFDSGSPGSLLAYGGNLFVVVAVCRFQVRTHTLLREGYSVCVCMYVCRD